jgi:gliding motility-associated-like protein
LVIPNVVVTSSKVGNDKFFIYTGDVKEFSCTIYNRWGNVMSQMNDLQSAWDCKSSNGQIVDEGTYMYAVRILYNNGTEAKRTGYFEVKH